VIPISLTYIAVGERSEGESGLATHTEVGELSPRIETGRLAVSADRVEINIVLQADQVYQRIRVTQSSTLKRSGFILPEDRILLPPLSSTTLNSNGLRI
jgi:CRISPR/Cas system CMR subunit Cmr4 (Cas7 group RAMP superfamily)